MIEEFLKIVRDQRLKTTKMDETTRHQVAGFILVAGKLEDIKNKLSDIHDYETKSHQMKGAL